VASDGVRPSWRATVVRESTVVTAATMIAAATVVARFKRYEILTHCFSILDGICWTTF